MMAGACFTVDWPPHVRECLEEPEILTRYFRAQSPGVPVAERKSLEPSSALRLHAGACSFPHPEKTCSTGGADSYFMANTGTAVGVADGVGEWEWRFKCNPRAFADELMWGAQAEAQDIAQNQSLNAAEAAVRALRRGYHEAKSIGSSTALVAILNSAKSLLGVANLGDSTLIQLRRDWSVSQRHFRCVTRTSEQQHSFNCPYQLRCIPTEADYPRLIAEGKQALVRAVQRCSNKEDVPEDAEKYILPVMVGDLLVLGTDGVFDNLHDEEVCELVSQSISPLEAQETFHLKGGRFFGSSEGLQTTAPERLAMAVAEAARYRSQDNSIKSPFSVHASKAGLCHVGGKMDDITCVCAWVVRTTDC
jgi:serine/threonine protein phosphatase PrpC